MLKSVFSMFSSQDIGSSLVLFEMVFEALKSKLFKFELHSLGPKLLKIQNSLDNFHLRWLKIKRYRDRDDSYSDSAINLPSKVKLFLGMTLQSSD